MSVQHQVERRGGEREVELLLRLRQRVRVGRRGAGTNLRGDAEELGELIDLRLVQMGNGFHVGETVAAFDEEPLIVLQPVGCADDRVVEPIGMVILEHRTDALFEVRRRDNLPILGRREAYLADCSARSFNRQVRDIQAVGIEPPSRQDHLEAPVVLKVGYQPADRGVASPVAPDGREDLCDVFDLVGDAQRLRATGGEAETVAIRILFGHQQAEYVGYSHGSHRERRAHGAVDAAAHAHDQSPPNQRIAELLAQRSGDPLRLFGRIEVQVVRQTHVAPRGVETPCVAPTMQGWRRKSGAGGQPCSASGGASTQHPDVDEGSTLAWYR